MHTRDTLRDATESWREFLPFFIKTGKYYFTSMKDEMAKLLL